jgi:hypothetical protein
MINLVVYLNKLVACACICIYGSTAVLALLRPTPPLSPGARTIARDRVITTFAQPESAYRAIGQGALLALHYDQPTPQLPDLRSELMLFGIDERPDADPIHPLIHIGLRDTEEIQAIPAQEHHYLLFDRASGLYRFSPCNRPTNLWLSLKLEGGIICSEVRMLDREGRQIDSPTERAAFELATAHHRPAYENWQVGSHRVDNSLLARLQTRWFGEDQFLADHGGDEFAWTRGKQRLDFGQGDELYSCFLAEGESLVWKGERWHNLRPGEPSRGLPILYLKTLKEKLMLLELWDELGRSRVTLSLMRSRDSWMPKHFKETLHFIGARTWSEYVLAVGDQRLVVSPQEWLLLAEKGWQVLRQVEEIDSYVNGHCQGELLVLEGMRREGGAQVLKGHLYNASRTGMEPVEIALTPQTNPGPESLALAHGAQGGRSTGEMVTLHRQLDPEEVIEEGEELLSLPAVMRGLTQQLNEVHP